MFAPFAEEVVISYELPVGEAQQVEVWFTPKSRQLIVELGRLEKSFWPMSSYLRSAVKIFCSLEARNS